MIVITTPTGDIGHQVLKHVVQGSEPVRVVARDPSRIPQEIRQRIEIHTRLARRRCNHREGSKRRRFALLADSAGPIHDTEQGGRGLCRLHETCSESHH